MKGLHVLVQALHCISQVLQESYPEKDTLWSKYECLKFIPFNPVDKYTIAVIKDLKSGEVTRIMKGAPQVPHLCLLPVQGFSASIPVWRQWTN